MQCLPVLKGVASDSTGRVSPMTALDNWKSPRHSPASSRPGARNRVRVRVGNGDDGDEASREVTPRRQQTPLEHSLPSLPLWAQYLGASQMFTSKMSPPRSPSDKQVLSGHQPWGTAPSWWFPYTLTTPLYTVP